MRDVVDEFKKVIRDILSYERHDVEKIDESLESGRRRIYGSGFYVDYEKRRGFEIVWDDRFGDGEVKGKDKEVLYKVLCLDENEVLNCGKVENKWVGIGSVCCCVYYREGKEMWDLGDYGLYEKWDSSEKWYRKEGV